MLHVVRVSYLADKDSPSRLVSGVDLDPRESLKESPNRETCRLPVDAESPGSHFIFCETEVCLSFSLLAGPSLFLRRTRFTFRRERRRDGDIDCWNLTVIPKVADGFTACFFKSKKKELWRKSVWNKFETNFITVAISSILENYASYFTNKENLTKCYKLARCNRFSTFHRIILTHLS